MPEKFLVFDVWGDYAHFKKYYTTSSPLTFSVPPRTAVIGLISAIIGKDKKEYLALMTKDKAEIAIQVINPIKKIRITHNLINTKGGFWRPTKRSNHAPRTQICFEYLKNPKFRIYFRHFDSTIYNMLKQHLEKHLSVYTPCLGLSELIADFNFVAEYPVSKILTDENFSEIQTVLPLSQVIELDLLQSGKKYLKERIPVEMLPDRIVTEYSEVLYEIEGKTIHAKVKKLQQLSNGDIITPL